MAKKVSQVSEALNDIYFIRCEHVRFGFIHNVTYVFDSFRTCIVRLTN